MKSLIMRVKDVVIEKIGFDNVFYLIFSGILLSLSMITQIYVPDEFKKNINWLTYVLMITSGFFFFITGLVPIIMRLIHKVLKAVWDSKWYVSIMLPAFFMSLIISLVSLDVYSSLLYIFAKAVLIFCVVWLMFYITLKIASLDIDKNFKNIPEKKIKLKKTHRQKNKLNRLNRMRGRV